MNGNARSVKHTERMIACTSIPSLVASPLTELRLISTSSSKYGTKSQMADVKAGKSNASERVATFEDGCGSSQTFASQL